MSRVDADALSAPPISATELASDGRARRWESHRATRRDELTRAARRAIHHGGPDLSMDEIANAIGTSKSIVYRYFTDRSGLQTAVGEAVLNDLGAALTEASFSARTPEQTIRAMVGVYLDMVSNSPSVYAFVTSGNAVADTTSPMRTLADDVAGLLEPVLADVLRATDRDTSNARVWAAGVIGFVRGAAEMWLAETAEPAGRDVRPLPALADAITDWICLGTSGGAGIQVQHDRVGATDG